MPFATSGGSGLGKMAETLQELVPAAVVKDGKLLNGKVYAEELKKWADKLLLIPVPNCKKNIKSIDI